MDGRRKVLCLLEMPCDRWTTRILAREATDHVDVNMVTIREATDRVDAKRHNTEYV